MEAGSRLVAQVDELLRLFNARSLDLPDGLFTRRTQLLLNEVPFEAMLGRPADDPLVLMIARGAAGYRFACKAVQHAVPDALLERGQIQVTAAPAARHTLVTTACWLSGHYRGSQDAVNDVFDVSLLLGPSGAIEQAAVTLDEAAVTRLRDARTQT